MKLEGHGSRKAALLTRRGGFTLIEMAIVLIIIGLIIGAVLKGQDLILNSRSKKFANFIRQAESSQWTFFDRNGYFGGDSENNGVIMDQGGENAYTDLGSINNFSQTLKLGATVFRVGFRMAADVAGGDAVHPAIVLTREDNGDFTDDEIEMAKSFDSAIDGSSDAANGKVWGVGSAAIVDGRGECTTFAAPLGDTWTGTVQGVVYLFDTGLRSG